MKNRIKLIGIVVAAAVICLSMSSCDFFKTGGTVEIVNQTVGRIIAYHNKIGTSFAHDASSEKIIESGQTGTWHFDEDTDVTFYWAGNDTGGTTYNGDKSNGQWGTSFTIEKGETKTIIAK